LTHGFARRENAMTDDVKFIRGNDRINQLSERPDLAPGIKRTRDEMEAADRAYAMGLAALRQAAELTQVELAKKLGVTQAAVSRMEQPHDMLLSTLNAYLEAVGGHATMIVRFDSGQEVELDLPRLR
jgi:DNA-binding XRE family transcriptional regulator